MNIIHGSSSLLFLISTAKAFSTSNLLSWKLSNCLLVIASFLCNATAYKSIFLLFDYIAIYLVCVSYINNIFISVPYTLLLIHDYYKYNSIENIKDIALITAIGKAILYTYLYVDKMHYYIILLTSICTILIYKIRCYLHEKNNKKYRLPLTYLLHICIAIIIYIASITANKFLI
jgi:hypothetical protein